MGARATSGHYFTYTRNFKTNKWTRISDEQVTEVTEEEVFKISKGIITRLFLLELTRCFIGGYKDCCAYSLFYIQEGMTPHGHSEDDLKEMSLYMDSSLEEDV